MKQHYLALLIAMSMLAGYNNTSAQYNSVARVNAGGDRALCGSSCFELTANLTDVRSTNNYIIDSSIDFNNHYPFYIPGSNSIGAENNVFSGPISLPFTFCFYGKAYMQLVIGSNGIISFDEESITKRCEPVTKKQIPTRAYAYAAIMPAYEALDITLGGSIYYSAEGYAPNRRFIINYTNIPLKTCSNDNVTFQVVLYETTNVIELFLKDKPSCLYYHDGSGIAGIQNNQREGLALPGKNATRWGSTGMNAAYRFIPYGDAASQFVQLSDIGGKILSSVQAVKSENGQLSASFGKICVEDNEANYIVSTIYSNCRYETVSSDTIYVTKDKDCGTVNHSVPVTRPEQKPVAIDGSRSASETARMVAPGREFAVNHVSTSNPTTCLGINGSINLHGLLPGTTYTVAYSKNGQAQKAILINSNAAGAIIISRLSAGSYSNIKVSQNGTSTSDQGTYVLTDPAIPMTPVAENNGPVNPGEQIKLAVSNRERVSYTWLGPGFAAVNAAPVIMNAQPYNAGTYTVIATKDGCNSLPAKTIVAINNKGGIPDRTVPIRFNNNRKPITAPVRITPAVAVKQKPVINTPLTTAKSKPSAVVAKSKSVAQKPVALVKTKPSVIAKTKTATIAKPATIAKAKPGVVTKKPQPIAKAATIKQVPVKVYANSNSPVCAGNTLKLHATAVNGTSYSWEGPNGFTSNAQNPALNNVDHTAAGIYTVKATNKTGSYAVNTIPVQIGDALTINVKDHTDPKVCYGYNGSITLSGFNSGKSYRINYTKNGAAQDAGTLIANNEGDIVIGRLGSGTYTNIYAGAEKCSSNKVGPVTIDNPQAPRTPLAGNSGAVDQGGSVILNATDIEGATYTWIGPNKFTANTQNPALNNIQPNAAGTYTVVASVDGCNSEPATTVVTVRPLKKEIIKKAKPAEAIATTKSTSKEYKGIQLSHFNAFVGETVTADYTDPIREPSKIKWNFGDATVVSGSGTGPYVLTWNTTGQKTISLKLPFKIPGYGDVLRKDVYITGQAQVAEEVIAPDPGSAFQESIRARHEEEEITTSNVKTTPPVITEPIPAEEIRKPIDPVEPAVREEEIAISRENVCLNDTATISLEGTVPDAAELNWDFSGATIISGTGAGPYVVRWDEDGAKSVVLAINYSDGKTTLGKTINVKPAPKAEFTAPADACPGETVSLEINGYKDRSDNHSWDFDGAEVMSGDDGGPYEVKWQEPGKKVVSLTVRDAGGCTSLPSREIIHVHADCCGITLPSAFTPNSDGKNDIFRAVSTGPHTIVRFVVRNRFGREIFSTNNEGEGWDGTLNGTPQEIGTYSYQVRYRCGDKLYEKDGEVMLLR